MEKTLWHKDCEICEDEIKNYREEGIDYPLFLCKNMFILAVERMQQEFHQALKQNKVNIHGENAFEDLERALQRAPVIFRRRTPTPILGLLIENKSYVIKVMRDVLRIESRLKTSRRMMLTYDEKEALLDEAVKSVKFMEEIAVMAEMSTLAERIRSTFYDVNQGGRQKLSEGNFIFIETAGLTKEQLRLSPFAKWFVHEPKIFTPKTVTPPPKKRARTVTPPPKKRARTVFLH